MRVADWLSLFGLIFGPIVAVLISLWAERRRGRAERRGTLLRSILVSRRQPADAAFHASMKIVPLEFRGEERVLNAWETYMAAVATPIPEDQAIAFQVVTKWNDALSELLVSMLVSLGHTDRTAREIVRVDYDPKAAGFARELQENALRSLISIAIAAERSAVAAETMVSRMPPSAD